MQSPSRSFLSANGDAPPSPQPVPTRQSSLKRCVCLSCPALHQGICELSWVPHWMHTCGQKGAGLDNAFSATTIFIELSCAMPALYPPVCLLGMLRRRTCSKRNRLVDSFLSPWLAPFLWAWCCRAVAADFSHRTVGFGILSNFYDTMIFCSSITVQPMPAANQHEIMLIEFALRLQSISGNALGAPLQLGCNCSTREGVHEVKTPLSVSRARSSINYAKCFGLIANKFG